jgi:hypothetical protein
MGVSATVLMLIIAAIVLLGTTKMSEVVHLLNTRNRNYNSV